MSEEIELSPKGIASEIGKQLKPVMRMIFDSKAIEPEGELQEFMRDAQAVLANLLSTFIHVVLLLLLVQQTTLFVFELLPPKWVNYVWQHWVSPRNKLIVFLIILLVFVYSLRRLLIIANFIRSYRIVAVIATLATFIFIGKSLPKLFAAKSLFETGGEILTMIWEALSK